MNHPIDITGVILQTPRLILRPWQEDDLQDFYEYARMDGVGQMAGWWPHRDIEESRRILAGFIRDKRTFALGFQGKVIGSLGIHEYHEQHYPELDALRGQEIGYVLSKDYWGNGLMTEAVKAVTDYLFKQENLDFILVGHFDHNNRSRRVIEKCGFRYIKTCEFQTRFNTLETSLEYILYHPRYDESR